MYVSVNVARSSDGNTVRRPKVKKRELSEHTINCYSCLGGNSIYSYNWALMDVLVLRPELIDKSL